MSGCRNITFQLVDVDRTIGGASSYGVKMAPATNCGIEYSRIYVGGIVPASGNGWVYNVSFAIEINNKDPAPRGLPGSHEPDLGSVRQGRLH